MTKSTMKVLLVGNNNDDLTTLKEALRSDDIEFTATASLGPAGLTWAETIRPDMVVVVADGSIARPVAVTQALAHGEPSWTVVVLADRFERELVRRAMLVGARDVLIRTASPAEIRQALATAREADLARRGSESHGATAGQIISLVGVKGGIGKTTASVNLAVALAQESGRSVALVDLDLPFGDLAMMLDLKPQGSVMSVLARPAMLEDPELLQQQLCAGPAGIYVLPAPLGAPAQPVDSAHVGPLLRRLAGLFDYVVVDTPGGFGEFTAAALDISDATLLITTPEAPTLRRTELGIRQLVNWEYPTNKLKIIVNRASLKTGISEEEVVSILSQPVACWFEDEPATIRAAAAGQPLVLVQPNARLSVTFRALARHLAGLPEVPRRSLWTSFFGRKAAPSLARAS